MDLDSELPPLAFIEHNSLFNAGAWRLLAVARHTDAPPEAISWLQEHGKIALHAAYNEMRDHAN